MEYEFDAIKGFQEYCSEKRRALAEIADTEQRALQEKVLVARSLLHHETEQMALAYAKYTAVLEEKTGGDAQQLSPLQEAMMSTVCAGLEDTSFNKWKANLTDAVCQVQETEQVGRMPRFSKACDKILDSLDIDFSDVEAELRVIFEPECIYNTLILLVTAIKSYCEFLDGLSERQKKSS
ncbi:MAG: hypothetical protein K2P39_12010 [Lachnospiraceae bacterium]|nr:hypothetical protein [Lachnospiraceae bacterium]